MVVDSLGLAVDNFDFTRKIVKKNLGEKLVKMLGFCQNSIFWQKFDFSNSVQDKGDQAVNLSYHKKSHFLGGLKWKKQIYL